MHLKLTQKLHNPALKNYTDHERVVQFSVRDFENMDKEGAFKGYDGVDILHDPREQAKKSGKE